jgi:hypothetical protein
MHCCLQGRIFSYIHRDKDLAKQMLDKLNMNLTEIEFMRLSDQLLLSIEQSQILLNFLQDARLDMSSITFHNTSVARNRFHKAMCTKLKFEKVEMWVGLMSASEPIKVVDAKGRPIMAYVSNIWEISLSLYSDPIFRDCMYFSPKACWELIHNEYQRIFKDYEGSLAFESKQNLVGADKRVVSIILSGDQTRFYKRSKLYPYYGEHKPKITRKGMVFGTSLSHTFQYSLTFVCKQNSVSLMNFHESIRCSGDLSVAWSLVMLVPSVDSTRFRQFLAVNLCKLRGYNESKIQRECVDQVVITVEQLVLVSFFHMFGSA